MWSFHARAPTRAVWPVIVRKRRFRSASQICTRPLFVPMAICEPLWIQETDVTVSFSRSQSFFTSPEFESHR